MSQVTRKFILSLVSLPLSLLLCGQAMAILDCSPNPTIGDICNLQLLGKYVFFDKTLSGNNNMGCVTCHDPASGGTGSVSGVNLHQVVITGSDRHTLGNLKPPTNIYASKIPAFHKCDHGGIFGGGGSISNWCGGNFWSGRAEGIGAYEYPIYYILDPSYYDMDPTDPFNSTAWVPFVGATEHIGTEIFYSNPTALAGYAVYFGATADQALNPIPNPVEQNLIEEEVCNTVQDSKYAPLYEGVWGEPINCSTTAVPAALLPDGESYVHISFKRLMLAVCAWQDSDDLNTFSSKRDLALASDADGEFPLDDLTVQENEGHDLFYGKAGCSGCHSDHVSARGRPEPVDDGTEPNQLYTANDYHNIGVPFNPEIPQRQDQNDEETNTTIQPDPDLGIRSHLGEAYPAGFFKTPTIRNVGKIKPTEPGDEDFIKAYMHNGYFKSLKRVVHFYNTAFLGNCVKTAVELCDGRNDVVYEDTTAAIFNITRCPDEDEDGNPVHYTDKQAEAANCWSYPEFPNSNDRNSTGALPRLVGNLLLTNEEEDALVAYMMTLSDLETTQPPPPYKGGTNGRKKK